MASLMTGRGTRNHSRGLNGFESILKFNVEFGIRKDPVNDILHLARI